MVEPMAETISLACPDVGPEEIAAVVEVLEDQHLSLGPRLEAFEQAMARYVGTREAVAVSSGTAALHMLVHALGWGPGDEVVTTPFSFISSSNCLLFEGVRPVFADIDPVTWDMDPAAAEAAIGPRCRGLLPVHVFGRPCPMPRYMEIARRHDLQVIEDSCEALGSRIGGRMAGAFARAGCFAFYPNKQITTGEGGMVVTDDRELAATLRSLRNQGRGADGTWLSHERLGWNYRIPDILCALGLVQLRRLESFIERRQKVYELYAQALGEVEGIILPPPATAEQRISWFVYVIALEEGSDRERRGRVLDALRARGIGCRNYFAPIHLQPFYRERFGLREGMFPVTESVAARTIALPFHTRLDEGQVGRVAEALREALAQP
ncbi:MAG: DegT/DnrJ/EryC1/StrS family aminotransferase [Acidobacteriota bacterium]|nr:DegT/DnrJ/EryC1/StrS family aminotransferase [Acidobacteriota bacterium]MDQ7087020.1 DegT/DnrJ/EryC1/StrS family aminotransferase [Acidobacteriota bacterium]